MQVRLLCFLDIGAFNFVLDVGGNSFDQFFVVISFLSRFTSTGPKIYFLNKR